MDFQIGEIVKTLDDNNERMEGVVKHITCFLATGAGGKKCDRNNCNHSLRNHVWVKWPSGKLCSYSVGELEHDEVGEDTILEDMREMINATADSEKSDDRAIDVVNTIVKSRKRRANAPAPAVRTNDRSLMGMIKADGVNAAYRVTAKQINNGLRTAIVDLLKKQGTDNANIEGMSAFLQTEWGSALLGMVAGYGLTYVPMIKENPKAQRLAKEFRVSSMALAGNELVSSVFTQLLPAVQGALASLPEENISSLEGQKSTEEKEVEVEVDISDFTSLEGHLEEEAERMVQGVK